MLVTLWCFFDRGTDGQNNIPQSYHKTERAAQAQLAEKGIYSNMYGIREVPAVLLKGKYYRLVTKNSVVVTP